MNRIKKIAFVASVGLMMFFTCSHVNAQTEGFDNIKIGDCEYAVKILSISKNSQGNVEVKVTGYRLTGYNPSPSVKYWQAVATDGSVLNVHPALGLYIVSNGKSVQANGYSIEDTRSGAKEDAIVSKFPTTVTPSEVVFFDTDDNTKKVIFDAKTKKPEK